MTYDPADLQRRLRLAVGTFGAAAVQQEIGVARQTVRRWENGEIEPTPMHRRVIAEALDALAARNGASAPTDGRSGSASRR